MKAWGKVGAIRLLMIAGLLIVPSVAQAQPADPCVAALGTVNQVATSLTNAESRLAANAEARTDRGLNVAEAGVRVEQLSQLWQQALDRSIVARDAAVKLDTQDPPDDETLRTALTTLLGSDDARDAAREQVAALITLRTQLGANQAAADQESAVIRALLDAARAALAQGNESLAGCTLTASQQGDLSRWLADLDAQARGVSPEDAIAAIDAAIARVADGEDGLRAVQQEAADHIDAALERLRS